MTRLLAALRRAPDPIDDLIASAGVNRAGTGTRKLWPHPKPGTAWQGRGLRPAGNPTQDKLLAARLNLIRDDREAW